MNALTYAWEGTPREQALVGIMRLSLFFAAFVIASAGYSAAEPAAQRPRSTAIQCGGDLPAGSKTAASFTAENRGVSPATVDVTFRGRRPSSAEAERVLRACMDVALSRFGRTTDVMGTAWYSASGREANDDTVPLKDGSAHLIFETKQGKILTWKEREGTQTLRTANPSAGYFVEYEEEKVLVRPNEKFAMLDVVWSKKPDNTTIYRVLIDELKKAVAKQPRKWPTTAFAKTGTRSNPSSQQQIRGPAGRYISVEYDPRNGNVTDEQGKVIDSIR
jgi:hypothetical protein